MIQSVERHVLRARQDQRCMDLVDEDGDATSVAQVGDRGELVA